MSDLFKKIESSSNLDRSTIMNVAESVKNANFQDEKVVRNLIQQLSAMTGKSVNKKTEEQIVKAVTSQNMPLDMKGLNQMFGNR
ncbi:MAG TPA: stage VI sporulation protein F [Firmicutes bacterium]|nr:stage VI sporulation protein F [Bacillales bacterium]HJA40479.1 stage VI sporulation protein F [Bacillota bacterium]